MALAGAALGGLIRGGHSLPRLYVEAVTDSHTPGLSATYAALRQRSRFDRSTRRWLAATQNWDTFPNLGYARFDSRHEAE